MKVDTYVTSVYCYGNCTLNQHIVMEIVHLNGALLWKLYTKTVHCYGNCTLCIFLVEVDMPKQHIVMEINILKECIVMEVDTLKLYIVLEVHTLQTIFFVLA